MQRWRHQQTHPQPPLLTQSSFAEHISNAIRTARKQQDIFYKFAVIRWKDDQTISYSVYQEEDDRLCAEEHEHIKLISQYRLQGYFCSKTYIYMVFMRLTQMLEQCRQRLRLFDTEEKSVDEAKAILADAYNNQAYLHKHDVVDLLTLYNHNHRDRFKGLMPKKRLLSLAPIVKKSERPKPIQTSLTTLKTTLSAELKTNRDKDIASVKMMATEKRIEERKKKKKNIFKIYQVLDIKPFAIEKETQYRIKENMMTRNQLINEERLKWMKKCMRKTIQK